MGQALAQQVGAELAPILNQGSTQELELSFNETLMTMNGKQRKFAQEYIQTGNATQAAINAGYSEKAAAVTGSRILRNANIQTALHLANTIDQLKNGIAPGWKRSKLAQIAHHSSDPEADTWNPTAGVKAINELNQMDGHHAPKQVHTSLNVTLDYSSAIPDKPPIDV